MVNATGAFGTHGSDEHSDTGADIGRGHGMVLELTLMVMANNNRTVRVAEDDLCTHINQFIDKEETRFEHLLVNEHGAFRLGSDHKEDGEQVRRETGPRSIRHSEDRAVKERLDLIMLLGRNNDIVTIYINTDTETTESIGDNTEVAITNILDT